MSRAPTSGSLFEVHSRIPDRHHRRGAVDPLAAVLTLVSTFMLRVCRSLAAIRPMGPRSQPPRPRLGYLRRTRGEAGYRKPCTRELHSLPAAVLGAALT